MVLDWYVPSLLQISNISYFKLPARHAGLLPPVSRYTYF